MSWLNDRKQDVEAAIVGVAIGYEAYQHELEELDYATITEIAADRGIWVTRSRLAILDKAIDVGNIIADYKEVLS